MAGMNPTLVRANLFLSASLVEEHICRDLS